MLVLGTGCRLPGRQLVDSERLSQTLTTTRSKELFQRLHTGTFSELQNRFGVYIGDDSIGGLFIERFGFTPKYTPLSNLKCPPWSNDDLPEFADPPPKRQYDCVSLLLRLLDWIRGYESRVATTLGLGYRRQTLVQWNNGERLFIPAEQLASSWRRLSQTVAANAHTWIPIRSEPESDLLMQMEPDDE